MPSRTSVPRVRLICLIISFSLLAQPGLFAPASASVSGGLPKAMPARPLPPKPSKKQAESHDGELLVRFRQGITEAEADSITASFALKRTGRLRGASGVERLTLLPGQLAETVLPALQSNPSVEFAEPNSIITADQARPNDPRFPEQWALGGWRGRGVGEGVNALTAWAQTTGSASTVIAVIDSGMDFTHPDLRENLWTNQEEGVAGGEDGYAGDVHGWDWVSNSPGEGDESGHGTAVAGLIAAVGNNGEGVTGVMWHASLMSLRVLDRENKGSVADAVEAIDYAVAHGARVINCSWGLDEPSVALKQAVARAVMSDVTVVCSAGNGGQDIGASPRYPTAFDLPYTISVAAAGRTDELTAVSNWGAAHVAVAAPGEELLTTKAGGGYELYSGTSFAAAVVSGIAGLIRTLRPRLSAERTGQLILRGARKAPGLEDKVMAGGVADIPGALAAMNTLRPGEGLVDGDSEGGGAGGHPGAAVHSGVGTGGTAPGSVTPAAPPVKDAPAANLPDLNTERGKPHVEPHAIPPVPSTRRRCPPHNPQCNAEGGGAARPTPTPEAAPGQRRASLYDNSVGFLAALTEESLPTLVTAALNGLSPAFGVQASDYYRGEGGYGYSDAPHGRSLPVPKYSYIGSEPLNAFAAFAAQTIGVSGETVWVEDSLPAGAVAVGDADGWNWVGANPSPYTGSLAQQSAVLAGVHQHYFYNATSTLPVGAGEKLFAYVYIDRANVPTEVMLQWNDGTWEHRAYWGADQVGWGVSGTDSRRYMGALPAAGGWVRLEVPASVVGLEGHTLNGMAFTLYGGRAWWDRAGKVVAAYNGTPLTIPGNVEAEQFDWGGQSSGYFDTTPGSHGQDYTQPPSYPPPSFRQPTDVDIYKSEGYSGGYLIVMSAGDWMNYTVDVASSGAYTIDMRTYYWNAVGGTFHIEFDGVNKTGTLQMPGGARWDQVTKAGVQLTAGRHIMRVVCDTNAPGDAYLGDIDFIRIVSATARPGSGLTAEYYNGDSFQTYVLTRTDAAVDFNWGNGSPAAGVNADFFTVRWTGAIVPRYTENYTFYTYTDDGVRLWIDGQLVIDKWIDQAPTEWTGSIALEANRQYAVRMEFYEHWGGATAQLRWASPSQAYEIVPQSRLYGCWKGADQFTNDFYQGALARRPSANELNDWTANLMQAQGDAQIIAEAQALGAQVFRSAEYINRNRTDSEYVSDLYWAYLQRAPDTGGWNFWTGQITPCGTDQQCRDTKRADVRRAFDQSGEFQEKMRAMCGTSNAAPDNGGVGYNFSTARLDPSNQTGRGGVDPYSRNFNWSVPLVSLPGRAGLDLGLALSYNSLVWSKDAGGVTFDADHGFPSPGFRLGFPSVQPRFYNPQTGKYAYMLVTPSGARVELRQVGTSNVYESADSSYVQLTDTGTLTLLTTDGSQLSFSLMNGEYRCTQVKDRNGNYQTVAYYADGRIDRVIDTLGRTITFNYDAYQNLITITQPWRRESPTGVVDETHTWASFGYTNLTLQPSFSNLAVMGDQPGAVIPVINQVGMDDGSYYKLSYNQWGQVWKVTHYAADSSPATDNHALSYTSLNLPGSDHAAVSPQTDCPRFTEQRVWVENGVRNQSAEVTTTYSPWAPNVASCDITPPDPTPADPSDNTVFTELYATGGWQRGLTTRSEVRVNGVLRKWTVLTWGQDDANLGYRLNPRVTDTQINDSEGNHRGTSVTYTQFGLPQDVTEYTTSVAAPIRTTRTEYNLAPEYTSRRIIGLPSFQYLYEGAVAASNLRAKVGYVYDDNTLANYLQGLPSAATQHDATNYGAGLRWRGNANRVRRYELNTTSWAETGAFTETQTGYYVSGTPAFLSNEVGHLTTLGYADNFYQGVNRSNPALQTYAYPTSSTIADPTNITSSLQYNYDLGQVTQSTDAKNAITMTRYDSAGRAERVTRRDGVNNVDKGYTRWAYPTSMGLKQTYVQTDASKPEAYSAQVFDGAGRVRATAADHLGSTGGYAAQLFDFDELGRSARQSNPTETNASGAAWPATGDDDPANGGAGWVYTSQGYDWNGRPTVTTNPDSTTRTVSYGGCGCAGGEVSTLTDEVGHKQRVTSDALGRSAKLEDLNTDDTVYRTTTTSYNARDQVTQVVVQVGTSGTAQTTTTEYDGYGRVWKSRIPQATASTVFTYYADDSLHVRTDARGATATYNYNNRGLPKDITYALGTDVWGVSYGYDAVGNRTSMNDGMGSVTYNYDTLSRLSSETRSFTELGRSFTTTYGYNLADELTLVTDHFGSTVTYTRDRTGRLTDVPGYTTGIKYRAWGALKEQALSNGRSVAMSYNTRMQVSQFNVPGVTGWQYQYNGDGSLRFVSNLQQLGTRDERLDRKLTYDTFGRLSLGTSGSDARGEAGFNTGPYKQNYGHDVWDHLTFRDNLRGNVYNSYSATYVNNRNQNAGWQYDANGTLTRTQEGTSTTQYTYNCADHLVTAVMTTSNSTTTVSYGYDGDGRSVVKVETNVPTTYYVRASALQGQVLDEVNTSGAKVRGYVYQEGRLIAKQEGAQPQWDVRDPSNFSNWVLNSTGGTASHVELDPLGTTVDPNNVSYSQSPAGFYGSASLQGTYCRVNGLGIAAPCSLAEMLNSHGFNQTVTVNGEEMPLSMAQGLADIGRINPNDIIFGNPWDLENMLPRLTFRQSAPAPPGTIDARRPYTPPTSGGSPGPSARNFFFNWGAFRAGYLWVSGYGSDSRSEFTSPGAFIQQPRYLPPVDDGVLSFIRDKLEWVTDRPKCKKFLEDIGVTDVPGLLDKVKSQRGFVYTNVRINNVEASYTEGTVGYGNAQIQFAAAFGGPFKSFLSAAVAGRQMVQTALHELIHAAGSDDMQMAAKVYALGYKSPLIKPPQRSDYKDLNSYVLASSGYWNSSLEEACGFTLEEYVSGP